MILFSFKLTRMTFSSPANFNEICPTRTSSIRPASQITFKYVLGVGFGTSGADGVVGPSGSPDGATVPPSPLSPGVPVSVPGVATSLPLPSSARGAIVSPASVAITVYGLEVTQVDNAKTTAMANARILFVFCFMSSDSFLQLSIFLG